MVYVSTDYGQANRNNETSYFEDVERGSNSFTEPVAGNRNGTEGVDPGKKSTRKRLRNESEWIKTKIKTANNDGTAYVNPKTKKTHSRVRSVQPSKCTEDCFYECHKIPPEKRQNAFDNFWKLSAEMKKMFYLKTTKCLPKKKNKKQVTRRKNTYQYFVVINGKERQVCRSFYLTTFDITERRVHYAHEQKNTCGTPTPPRKKIAKNKTSEEDMDFIRNHINSFPKIESHYRRAETSKQYLESNLNMARMYSLYCEKCEDEGRKSASETVYRKVFNTEFNLSFHTPKNDRCDLCEEFDVARRNGTTVSDEKRAIFENHKRSKAETKVERDMDRLLTKPVLCFDLENVFALPRGNASCFFYKRKINTYNLTAVLHYKDSAEPDPSKQTKKEIYCALWSELIGGRTGNDIASAVAAILSKVFSGHPNIKELITWSDSCVPQNRNSIMSYQMQDTLKKLPHVQSITMKFCEPGHSSIQEVDAVHSAIEHYFAKLEIHSPLTLTRLMIKARKKEPYIVIQMKSSDFLDFQSCSKEYKGYSKVPFTKVKELRFVSTEHKRVYYKENFGSASHELVKIAPEAAVVKKGRGVSKVTVIEELLEPGPLPRLSSLPEEKIKDVKSLLKFMPLEDQAYYKAFFDKT